MELVLLLVFTSLDLLFFHIYLVYIYIFRLVLVPMFLVIGIYGSRQRKIRAARLENVNIKEAEREEQGAQDLKTTSVET